MWSASVLLDFGADRGQNPGTLFEYKDAAGRATVGAGFPAVYNTRFRMDRFSVQFFVRPPGAEPAPSSHRLPRPDNDCGLYMFDDGGRLFAINDALGTFFHEWDPSAGQWRRATGPAGALKSSADAITMVAGRLLRFTEGRVEYDGRVVLPAPPVGRYAHFYYGQGHLYFFHTHRSRVGAFTRLYACPWTPASDGPVDVTRGDVLAVAPPGVVTWCWGQLGRQVVTVTNYGGVHAHDERGWRTLRPPSPGVSYQVYSMVTYGDRLLLGQYPSGEVVEFDGETLRARPGFPPRLASVSPSARECQTLALYRGELFAGVWPWAEVWRHSGQQGDWHSLGRLFTHPEPTATAVHPYEKECVARGLVVNDWGQRVTSMVCAGDSLYFSTSAKGNHRWDPKLDFLTEAQRQEYGAVLQLRLPGSLSATVQWKDRPTRLEFQLFPGRMAIRQDGHALAEAPLPLDRPDPRGGITWGSGVFGPLSGKIVAKRIAGVESQS